MIATKPRPTPTRAKPINSRAKGASAEREFAQLIHQHLGVDLRRNLEQSRSGGHDLVAVGTDSVSLALDAFAIEIKRYALVTPGLIRPHRPAPRNHCGHQHQAGPKL